MLTIFKFLDRTRFTTILASPIKAEDFFARIRELGGCCVYLPAPASLCQYGGVSLRQGFLGRLRTALDAAWYNLKAMRFLLREKIDLVQCHNLRALLIIGLAAKLTRRPLIWYVKGHLDNPVLDRLGFFLANRIIFQNQTNRDRRYPHLIKRYAGKIDLLPNGVDLDEILVAEGKAGPNLAQELGTPRGRLNIGYIGQISPLKGLDYLLEAMVEVQREIKGTQLYLVGDHAAEEYRGYQPHLQQFIRSQGLTGIHFTGWRADALEILSLMDLFVLPSLSEGVPKSIIEAMALGKPVVATRIGGIPELVREGETGLIVNPEDAKGLAAAIITLAKNQEIRQNYGEQGRRIAFQEFSIKKNIAGLEKVYAEMLQ